MKERSKRQHLATGFVQRKKPVFEKIARELQEEVEYIRTFVDKRKKIQSTHEGRKPICTTHYEPHD